MVHISFNDYYATLTSNVVYLSIVSVVCESSQTHYSSLSKSAAA